MFDGEINSAVRTFKNLRIVLCSEPSNNTFNFIVVHADHRARLALITAWLSLLAYKTVNISPYDTIANPFDWAKNATKVTVVFNANVQSATCEDLLDRLLAEFGNRDSVAETVFLNRREPCTAFEVERIVTCGCIVYRGALNNIYAKTANESLLKRIESFIGQRNKDACA